MASTSQALVSPTRSPQPLDTGQVIRLLNSIVDVCLVYGFDETCMRELEAEEGVRLRGVAWGVVNMIVE